jgi:hypothetical protein
MRFPGVAISTLTALSVGAGVVQADEMFIPPSSLQQVPNPGRIVISPGLQGGTSQVVAPTESVAVSKAPVEVEWALTPEPQPPTAIEVAATPIEYIRFASQTAISETSYPLLQLVSTTAVDPTVNSSAAYLGRTIAIAPQPVSGQCPLDLTTIALAPDQVALARPPEFGPCPRPATIPVLPVPRGMDSSLKAKVKQFNQDSQAKYNDCIAAIAAAEQDVPTIPPRQYLRKDSSVPYPQVCVDLEKLRSESNALRTQIGN